jgi:hypothetical protein
LTGSLLGEWLETENVVTGLYPFMSMASKSKNYNLEEIYDVAMMNLNSFFSREVPPRNAKQSGSRWRRQRNTKQMKRS